MTLNCRQNWYQLFKIKMQKKKWEKYIFITKSIFKHLSHRFNMRRSAWSSWWRCRTFSGSIFSILLCRCNCRTAEKTLTYITLLLYKQFTFADTYINSWLKKSSVGQNFKVLMRTNFSFQWIKEFAEFFTLVKRYVWLKNSKTLNI